MLNYETDTERATLKSHEVAGVVEQLKLSASVLPIVSTELWTAECRKTNTNQAYDLHNKTQY